MAPLVERKPTPGDRTGVLAPGALGWPEKGLQAYRRRGMKRENHPDLPNSKAAHSLKWWDPHPKGTLMLTHEAIQQLAARPGVKKTAVENFLSTMGDSLPDAIANLVKDAKSYGWTVETIRAIALGVVLKFDVSEP